MNEIHFNFLNGIVGFVQGAVGNNALYWANNVIRHDLNNEIDPQLNQIFNRNTLLNYCINPNNSNLNVTLAILAWGNMRRDHGHLLFQNNWNILNEIITNLRNQNGYQNRIEAFNAFRNLRLQHMLNGLAAAYFTKLICFLSPNVNGYIMDQWTSKSINLLFSDEGFNVNLTGNWVNDINDGNLYNNFCEKIEELGNLLEITPMEAEMRIFSVGRGRGEWRNYVIENYNV